MCVFEGTFSASTGLVNISQCSNCPGGDYCAEAGLGAVSGQCTAGYYCPGSAIDSYGRTTEGSDNTP